MKYITFLIGNGFDINLGLKTKYSDFYSEYLESNKDVDKNSNIGKFCEMIESDYETWSDFESAFAQKIWGAKNDISDILYDFSTRFSDYLRKQVALCDYSDKKIPDIVKAFLTNGYDTLEPVDKQIIKSRDNELHSDDVTIDFINFNYTNTLDKLVRYVLKDKDGKILYSYRVSRPGGGSVLCNERIGEILHIHGKLGGYIIIGVDSLQQLLDENLKNNDKIARYCVKSQINEINGNKGIETKFTEMISRSSIIYAYGLSFGESDKSRWDIISKWLRANSGHKLIIFKLKAGFDKFEKAYPLKLLDFINEAKSEYLSLFGIEPEEHEKYYSQIFIVDSSAVLNFKLIDGDHGNGEDTDNVKETVTV